MKLSDPEAFINRRRRQIHVHSTIYYYFDSNIIDDFTYDRWSVELANAQREYPKWKRVGYQPALFADWTGETGMHLPVTEYTHRAGMRLLAAAQKRNHTVTPVQKQAAQKPADELNVVGYERD